MRSPVPALWVMLTLPTVTPGSAKRSSNHPSSSFAVEKYELSDESTARDLANSSEEEKSEAWPVIAWLFSFRTWMLATSR